MTKMQNIRSCFVVVTILLCFSFFSPPAASGASAPKPKKRYNFSSAIAIRVDPQKESDNEIAAEIAAAVAEQGVDKAIEVALGVSVSKLTLPVSAFMAFVSKAGWPSKFKVYLARTKRAPEFEDKLIIEPKEQFFPIIYYDSGDSLPAAGGITLRFQEQQQSGGLLGGGHSWKTLFEYKFLTPSEGRKLSYGYYLLLPKRPVPVTLHAEGTYRLQCVITNSGEVRGSATVEVK